MVKHSRSAISERIEQLSKQLEETQDPAKIRSLSQELIGWERELQIAKDKIKHKRTKTKNA